MAKNGKGKAPEASDATDNSQAPGGSSITLEQLQAMMNTAREAARRNPAPPVNNGVTADVAMSALMEMEEEGWREELLDPDLSEAERADIMARLDGNQVHRRWLNFMRTVDPPRYFYISEFEPRPPRLQHPPNPPTTPD